MGPLEPPYQSPSFRRNYTAILVQGHEIWNVWVDPFNLYPQLPFDTVLPSDAKYLGRIIILLIMPFYCITFELLNLK